MHLINNTLTDTEFVPTSQSFMWTYARTIPQCPHENNIRGKTADDETYSKMLPYADAISYCRLIEINGVVEIHPAVTLDQFPDMFIHFIESHGWFFRGGYMDITNDENSNGQRGRND